MQSTEDNSPHPPSPSTSTILFPNILNIKPLPFRSSHTSFGASHKMATTERVKQGKSNRKKSYRAGFSSWLVWIGKFLMMSMLFVAADGACTGSTNPTTCDLLPNGNGEIYASKRPGSLGGVVDDFFQNYRNGKTGVIGLSEKPSNSMTKAQVIATYGSIETWNTSQVTNMEFVFWYKKGINPDIRNWIVDSVVNMYQMFRDADAFNRDLSGWIVSSVTNMRTMFHDATAYTQTLCGNTWIESTATKTNMFGNIESQAKIGTVPCLYNACRLGKYLTTTTPKTCSNCPDGKYQDEPGFKGSVCRECSVGNIISISNGSCTVSGFDPVPNGNGGVTAADRVGTLGGVLDDFFQDYRGSNGVTAFSNKPSNSMTKAEVVATYGSIETWDTSQVTNMKYVFWYKKNINPDIRDWIVDSVLNMERMFEETDAFNIDLSGWIVSSVTDILTCLVLPQPTLKRFAEILGLNLLHLNHICSRT